MLVGSLACSRSSPPSAPSTLASVTPIESGAVDSLTRAITSAQNIHDGLPSVITASIDAGPAAVPRLRTLLASHEPIKSDLAAHALTYIGGESAVAALKSAYDSGNVKLKSAVASAMASTGSPSDLTFLRSALHGEHLGSAWRIIVAASLALGVLGDKDSLQDLDTTVHEAGGGLASVAAANAAKWIRGRDTVASDIDPVIAAVLRNGVPRADEGLGFFDPDRELRWELSGGHWRTQPATRPGELPFLRFEVHLSPDGLRALVSVSTDFGVLSGEGHDYVLAKVGSGWRVQGLFFTWIS